MSYLKFTIIDWKDNDLFIYLYQYMYTIIFTDSLAIPFTCWKFRFILRLVLIVQECDFIFFHFRLWRVCMCLFKSISRVAFTEAFYIFYKINQMTKIVMIYVLILFFVLKLKQWTFGPFFEKYLIVTLKRCVYYVGVYVCV